MSKAVAKRGVSARKDISYLTSRALERAVSKGTRHTYDEAIRRRGHIVTAKDGWIVKVNRNGTEERISKLPVSKSHSRIVLD